MDKGLEVDYDVLCCKGELMELASEGTEDIFDAFEYDDIPTSDEELIDRISDALLSVDDFDKVISALPESGHKLNVHLVRGKSIVNGLCKTPGNTIYLFLSSNGWIQGIKNTDYLEYLFYHELGHHIYGEVIQCYDSKYPSSLKCQVNKNVSAIMELFNDFHKVHKIDASTCFTLDNEGDFQEVFADLFALYMSFTQDVNYMPGAFKPVYDIFNKDEQTRLDFISLYESLLQKIKNVGE